MVCFDISITKYGEREKMIMKSMKIVQNNDRNKLRLA